MMPLWMFTLGSRITQRGGDIEIPYQGIVTSLIVLTAPSVIGMLLRWWKPQWKEYSDRSIRPMVGVLLFVFCTVRCCWVALQRLWLSSAQYVMHVVRDTWHVMRAPA